METTAVTIEQSIRGYCTGCRKTTIQNMTHFYIDVDQQDEDGIPYLLGYKCEECNHKQSPKGYLETFVVKAEVSH